VKHYLHDRIQEMWTYHRRLVTLSLHRTEIGKAQSISKRALADSQCFHLWHALLCKLGKNMAGRQRTDQLDSLKNTS
jgi:hypothetical protein